MLRESSTRRLHRWRGRGQWREVCRAARRWRRRTRRLRHNARITVVMRAWCGWRRIWLTIVTILQARCSRTRWQLGGPTITVVTVRFTRIVWVRLITNVRGAGCRGWWLINDFIMSIRTTRTCRWRWWRINRIRDHAAVCRWAWGAGYMITIIRVHTVTRVEGWHAYRIGHRRDFRDTLRFAQRRRRQWIRCLIILWFCPTLSYACAAKL